MSSPPEHEVLSVLGEEVTGVLGPVTLCIAVTVALVSALNPEGNSNNAALGIATAFYSESVRCREGGRCIPGSRHHLLGDMRVVFLRG